MQTSHSIPPKPENKGPRPSSPFLDSLISEEQQKFLRDTFFCNIRPDSPAVAEAMKLRGWPPQLRPDDPTDLLLDHLSEQPPAWLDEHRAFLQKLMDELLTDKAAPGHAAALLCLKSLVAHARAGLGTPFLKGRLDMVGLSTEDELDLYLIWAKIEERRDEELGGRDLPNHDWEVDLTAKPHLAALVLYLNREKWPRKGLFSLYSIRNAPPPWERLYLEAYLRSTVAALFKVEDFQCFKNFRERADLPGWLSELLDETLEHPAMEEAADAYRAFLGNGLLQKAENAGKTDFELLVNLTGQNG